MANNTSHNCPGLYKLFSYIAVLEPPYTETFFKNLPTVFAEHRDDVLR